MALTECPPRPTPSGDGWLIGASALWKLRQSPDYEVWVDRINRGLVAACITTRLEIAVSAVDTARWPHLRQTLLDPLLDAPTGLRSERIALEIIEALMARRLHRSVPVPRCPDRVDRGSRATDGAARRPRLRAHPGRLR